MQPVATALLLLAVGGLCCPLGAAAAVFALRQPRTGLLAASLGLAAGCMLFVSLFEILGSSVADVQHSSWPAAAVQAIVFLAFFVGVAACRCLDWASDAAITWAARRAGSPGTDGGSGDASQLGKDEAAAVIVALEEGGPAAAGGGKAAGGSSDLLPKLGGHADALSAAHYSQLSRTSVLIGLALALHSLPEGLATFVGYMASRQLGITVAVAICIHKLPEGVAIGVPVYFATGSRWRAVGWAALSGAATPLGGLIGLAIFQSGQLSPVVMGLIMAGVAGIMTAVVLQELLPQALAFDPGNRITVHAVLAGMGVMALSLVLLSLWG